MKFVSIIVTLLLCSIAAAQTSPPDTLDIYGGPGTLEGKFQTAAGQPDPQGWVGVDDSVRLDSGLWHVSTRYAANLDSTVSNNHAWWCGQDMSACSPTDSAWGYGNSWNEAVGTSRVIDPTQATTVVLTGILNVDLEPGYDYMYVEAMTATGPVELVAMDGQKTAFALSASHTWQPGDYVGDGADEVQIRLRVQSDGGWSDEDCSYPTAGAVQADNLLAAVSQPSSPPYPDEIETCEPGAPLYWGYVTASHGVGNFAQLWTGLNDMDPNKDNFSPQWAFINDGIIVPWLNPSYCWTKCYGPDSLSIYQGPESLRSSIQSPAIALPDSVTGTLQLAFDAYHDPAECYSVGLTWAMAATSDPTGQSGWTETWSNFIYFDGGPVYRRWEFAVDQNIVPSDSRFVRIKLQATNFGMGCWGAMDSPAPYLDNVRLQLARSPASGASIPAAFTASAAPNPFNPAVTIRWDLPRAGELSVRIHDARGRLIRSLRSEATAAGPGQITWRGRDDNGHSVAAGVYFCRIQAAAGSRLLKLTLLK